LVASITLSRFVLSIRFRPPNDVLPGSPDSPVRALRFGIQGHRPDGFRRHPPKERNANGPACADQLGSLRKPVCDLRRGFFSPGAAPLALLRSLRSLRRPFCQPKRSFGTKRLQRPAEGVAGVFGGCHLFHVKHPRGRNRMNFDSLVRTATTPAHA
jgi:hypothetical protein